MTVDPSITDRMQAQLDTWENTNDRRAIFLSCYAMMTRNMLVAVENGQFHDAIWVSTLLHRFADYYFRAVEAYDQHDRCSTVWRFAFDTTQKPDTHVMQDLILGVNAHINYDLVLTLVDVLHDQWDDLSHEQREQRYQDHCHVNTIIAATINSVQDQVIERYEPLMDIVDKLFGPIDEWLISRLIARWREEVWQQAGQLMACTDDDTHATLCKQVEQQTMQRAYAIAGRRGIAGVFDLM